MHIILQLFYVINRQPGKFNYFLQRIATLSQHEFSNSKFLLDERREGKAEGRVEGKAEEKNAIATLMLAKGCYSLQEISKLTKLSIEDIEKLEKEMHATEQS